MTSENLDQLSHYERIIQSHHHELEGIFLGFIDYQNKNIEYSELIPVSNISMIMPHPKRKNTDNNIFKIYNDNIHLSLSKKESRFFDVMSSTITNYSIDISGAYSLQISGVNETTKNNISKYINYQAKSAKSAKSVEEEEEFLKYKLLEEYPEKTTKENPEKTTKQKERNKTKHASGGKPEPDISEKYETVIIYKYMDPVIRMVCEYMILLDQYFKEKPKRLLRFKNKHDNDVDEAKLSCWLDFVWEENEGRPPREGTEGTVCVFGVGKIDCCSETLKNEKLSKLTINKELFDLAQYTSIITDANYKNPSFHTLSKDFKLPSAVELLRDKSDTDKMLLVKIMQKTIDKIIEKSGRAEGAVVKGQTNPYPEIHLLEVLDPANTTWILRSERYHLSRSPCVHNGLQTVDKIDHFLKYLNLWNGPSSQLEFAAVSWLHTIGHALDRLYCGHTGHLIGIQSLTTTVILEQIKNSFKIFMELMARKSNQPICDVIPNDSGNPDYVDLFFYICMNDIESVRNKLLKMPLDLVIRMKDHFSSNKTIDRVELTDLIIARINTFFSVSRHVNFPFFNINFSYTPNRDGSSLIINTDCAIKMEYSCKGEIPKSLQAFLRESPQ